MFTGKRVLTMNTRTESGAQRKTTVVTVVLDGVTEEQVLGLALRQLRVDLAVPMRSKGIPTKLEYHLKDHGIRNVMSAVREMTNEEIDLAVHERARTDKAYREEQIKKLQAMK